MSDLTQRRGKIARLPRSVRDQLNIRLDDGQEADQILPWLNDLPEVRQIITERFGGAPISAQNLSAWRQGGFQEWLLHSQFLDIAEHMREHVEELNGVIDAGARGLHHTVADYMVTQLSVGFAAFLATWDGATLNAETGALLKLGQFIIKLQRAVYLSERAALELPGLRRKAERKDMQAREANAAFIDYCREHKRQDGTVPSPFEVYSREKNKPEAPPRPSRPKPQSKSPHQEGGAPRRPKSPHPKVQSSSIKVNKGSSAKQASPSKSTEPPIVERVEFGKTTPSPSNASSLSSAVPEQQVPPLISPK
jgi:hypothetical protein